jgi:hypothetical protein
MTLREGEIAQSKRAQESHQKQTKRHLLHSAALSPLPPTTDIPSQIAPLTEKPRRKPKPKPKQKTKPKKWHKRPNEPLSHLLPEQVLTIAEWRRINRLSERNARRILADPEKRPKLVQLSPRRYGVRVADNKAWQESRSR